MAERKTNTAKSQNGGSSSKGKRHPLKTFLIFAAVVFLLLLFAGIAYCIFRIPSMLLKENPRFALRTMEVSSGYWQNNKDRLAERLELERGVNLFALDIRALRERLENIPNVEYAEVQTILPDTLVFKIIERIPRAVLFTRNSDLAVDEKGFKMKRSESALGNQVLPVITGLRSNEAFDRQIAPAMKLIMTALRDYQDISIAWISVQHESYLDVRLFYRRNPQVFQVLFPLRDYGFMLSVLQSAILEAGRRGELRTYFDLRTRGRVITR